MSPAFMIWRCAARTTPADLNEAKAEVEKAWRVSPQTGTASKRRRAAAWRAGCCTSYNRDPGTGNACAVFFLPAAGLPSRVSSSACGKTPIPASATGIERVLTTRSAWIVIFLPLVSFALGVGVPNTSRRRAGILSTRLVKNLASCSGVSPEAAAGEGKTSHRPCITIRPCFVTGPGVLFPSSKTMADVTPHALIRILRTDLAWRN